MKFKVYINVEGLEAVALGRKLYSWNFHVATVEDGQEDAEGMLLLREFEAPLPAVTECVKPVLAKLAKREQEIQAEAYREVQELKVRRDNLLSLTYTPVSVINAILESEL